MGSLRESIQDLNSKDKKSIFKWLKCKNHSHLLYWMRNYMIWKILVTGNEIFILSVNRVKIMGNVIKRW